MMEEIITLIIHEAHARPGDQLPYKLKHVLAEVSLIIDTMASDLLRIKKMEVSDDTKDSMIDLVLRAHKT